MKRLAKYKHVYVCSPLSAPTKEGITQNMYTARRKCMELRLHGIRAWAPHAYLPEFLDDNIAEERELALEFGKKMLDISDAVYAFGERISNGMKSEILYAASKGIEIIAADNLQDELAVVLADFEGVAK